MRQGKKGGEIRIRNPFGTSCKNRRKRRPNGDTKTYRSKKYKNKTYNRRLKDDTFYPY